MLYIIKYDELYLSHMNLNQKMENNIKLNVVFSVIMFAIYIRFFGYQSVERFNRHGITAIKLTEEGKTIPPPGKD